MTSNSTLYYRKAIFLISALIFSITLFSQTIIHQADFETIALDGWTQSGSDDIDWTRDSGGTPSNNTGPSSAQSGSFYMFTEASSGNDNKRAILESPTIDLSSSLAPQMQFYYHMYGGNMGDLYVDISINNGTSYPDNLWSQTSGQVQTSSGSPWIIANIDLSAYIGQSTIKLRFRGDTGNGWRSDMAIDNVLIEDNPPLTNGPGGITSDLHLWFKSNDGHSYTNGQSVSTWSSQGKGSDVSVDQVGREPTYYDNATRNINFNPVIEFDNTPSGPGKDPTFTAAGQQYLVGTDGFYTQEIFLVVMPDLPISATSSTMDLFCGDDPLHEPTSEDVTGIGYGPYTASLTGEMVTYAQNVQTQYRIADNTGLMSYDNVGIVNARNNPTANGMELFYNANNIETTEINTASFYNMSDTNFWIGRSEIWGAGSNARVVEIINYTTRKNDASLTDERNKIQSYLGIKYGITLGSNGTSQDYVDSTGSVIWDQSVNIGFNYDVAGIGRDDDSELNQKQSKSVNSDFDVTGQIRGLVSIGLTDLHDTNNENIINNPIALNDREFLTWGNNNGNLDNAPNVINVDMSAGIPDLSTPVSFIGMERVWRISEINGKIPKVKVSIPLNAVRNISPPGSYLMFISDTQIFDPTADYRVMTINGPNLESEYDFDGTKYFTFGYAPEVKVERSVYFDGVNDYIDMQDVLDLNDAEFTISAWIKRGANSGNTSILSKRDIAYTTGYDFKVTASGQIELSWENGGTQSIISDYVVPQNEWHQVAVIFNSGTANLYIDGILDKTIASLNDPSDTDHSFVIAGAGEITPTSIYEGNIDEVRIWNVALTVDQLRYIMNQELEKNTTFVNGDILPFNIAKNEVATLPWNNLAGYYPMSIYTYTNTNDESDNNNQGALRNLDTVDHQTAPLPYESDNNGSWDTDATWLNNSVQYLPNTIVNGTIVDWNIVETSHNVNTTRAVEVLGLKVNSNELSINSDNSLEITHYLKLDGVLDLDNESQLIQSLDSELDEDSSGYLERDQQGTANSFNYNYWSSSVGPIGTGAGSNNADQTVGGILFDGSLADNGTYPRIINFQPAYTSADSGVSSPINISTYWLHTFNGTSDDYNAWNSVNQSSAIKAGEGYTMKGTSGNIAISTDQNYVFKGKPNNGVITLTIADGDGRLVGNPYPSALDADEFIKDNISIAAGGRNGTTNVFNGAIYFWDHFGKEDSHYLAEYVGGYATYTLMGGAKAYANDARINNDGSVGTNRPEQFIPVNQGFFVNASLDTLSNSIGTGSFGGTITFKNSQRVFVTEGSGNSQFMKSANPDEFISSNKNENDIRPKIRLLFNSPKGYHRQLLVGADENASPNFDLGYDGQMVDVGSEDMYWDLENGKFVVQGIPEFRLDLEIPIGIIVNEEGLIQIEIDELENLEETFEIYIKDNFNGETYKINDTPFEIDLQPGEYKNRFALAFQPRLLGIDEIKLEKGLHIYMNNNISELQLKKIIDVDIESISLFNYLGQSLKVWNTNLDERLISLPINDNTGSYIVLVKTSEGLISKKIIKI